VQLEDKVVDDRETAHAESRQREDIADHGEQTLPAPAIEALQGAALEKRGELLGAIRMILDRQTLAVGSLRLPQREARALEALQVATSGRSSDLGQFVYASDRRDLLEQALAILQPNLTRADDLTARELHAQFADLAARVGDLRHQLTDLEDAQDEVLELSQKAALEAAAAEAADKPKPVPSPSDPDAPRPATTLTGPEIAEPPPATTTLAGPEIAEPPPAPTTLTGPEIAEPAPAPTTLTGPEIAEPAGRVSTLGDAETVTDASAEDRGKRSWWRKPFG
jgi:hypothetical protein